MNQGRHEWPALPYQEWAATKKTLHMYTQILGKVRLALAPPQPEWLHTCLHLDARGFTTGPIPRKSALVDLSLDLYDRLLRVRVSDGRVNEVALGPGRCVAEVWGDLQQVLATLDIEADLWQKPQEMADITPFSENRHDCALDPAQAQRFLALLATVQGVFEEFRSRFFGRSGIQFWWGSFDLALLLFTGRHLEAPADRGYIMRYDLDAEHMNVGFWPGDDNAPAAAFYGYLVPRPDGCETAPMEPETAGWVEAMGEWILPYDVVRTNPDPRRCVLSFLASVYRVATESGGWDAKGHVYTLPKPAARDAKVPPQSET